MRTLPSFGSVLNSPAGDARQAWKKNDTEPRLSNGIAACENTGMLVSIDLPDRLIDALELRAQERHSSVQAVALEAIESGMARSHSEDAHGRRVQLPLIRSTNPGSLRSLTNAEIDGILRD